MAGILILAFLAFIAGVQAQDYQVQNIMTVSDSMNNLTLVWDNPTVAFTALQLNYSVVNFQFTDSVQLANNVNTFTITGLNPGSEVHVTISTLLNGQVMATTPETIEYTALAPITVLKKYDATSDRLQIYFEMPLGDYDRIDLYAYDEAQNQYTASVPYGNDYITILSLPPGNNISFYLLTSKDPLDSVPIGPYLAQTDLDTVSASYDIISYKQISWSWAPLDGLFDTVTVDSVLVSNTPDAARSFISNSSLQAANCKPGYRTSTVLTYAEANEQNGIILSDLCPLSLYEVKFTVSRVLFDSTVSSEPMRTDYQNVDCETVTTTTIGNMTIFQWQLSKMYVDSYTIQILSTAGNVLVTQKLNNTRNRTNSVTIYTLDYNTQYVFAISVKRGRFESATCKTNVQTGDPCPTYDDNWPVKLNIAPYVYNVSIIINPRVFLYGSNIVNYTVIVGTDHDCLKQYDPNTCFTAFIFDANEWDQSSELRIDLSTDLDCVPSKVPCNVRFVLDKNYYVTLKGWSNCGPVYADTLVINIPTPFPLGVSIGVSVGVSVLIVAVLLTAIIVITFLQIKKRNTDESMQRLVDKSMKYTQD